MSQAILQTPPASSSEHSPLLGGSPARIHYRSHRESNHDSGDDSGSGNSEGHDHHDHHGHGHHDHHDHGHDHVTRKLWIASGLCFTFFLVELIGGIMSNSLAILSDSFHLLSDLAGFIISIASIYLARRKATKRHSFGFHRAEILGALASVLLIWIMTVFLVNEAIDRVQHPRPINGPMMLGIAVIGLVVNLILIFALGHGHAHAHGAEEAGHGHSHAHGGNMNLRAAVIHIIGDIVSSLGVIISSVIVTFWPEWVIVDPICTFLFSVIVMFTTFRLVKDSMVVLMEGTPSHIDPAAVEHDLASVPFVVSVHDLHIWTLTVGKEALAVHLCVSRSASDPSHVADGVLAAAHEILCTKYGVHHATIQIEAAVTDDVSFDGAGPAGHCRSAVCNGGVCPGAAGPVAAIVRKSDVDLIVADNEESDQE